MADIIDFTSKRKQKTKESPKVTFEEVVYDTIDDLLGDWERMARKNKLNEFFIAALPSFIDPQSKQNFMKDLNAIADLEKNLHLMLIIHAPGTIEPQQVGWVTQFMIGEHLVSTPDMAAEGYARCFGVLTYVTIKYNAQAVGLIE
jgi:hypothetical protein